MYIHLINDEKFLTPFMNRAERVYIDHLYIVFGPVAPYKFLPDQPNIIHVSQWDDYREAHQIEFSRIYVHLMTYQKIQWIKRAPKAPVYWFFYGNDLYELLAAFKGFELYTEEDRPKGLLSNIKGGTLKKRIQRYLKLAAYHRHFAPFVREQVDFWCFWSPGDYQLLTTHYSSRAKMIRFQYGAFNPADIDLVKNWPHTPPNPGAPLKILLNHSGSQSGNHRHLLGKLRPLLQPGQAELIVPLSYGDADHIQATLQYGNTHLPGVFKPLLDYLNRDAYFSLICDTQIAIFGHRRQEAGNTLFIALMSGTKVFLHPESVLLPFLQKEGYTFFTWADLGKENWLSPLSEEALKMNYELACGQFSEQRISENYHRALDFNSEG